MASSAVTAAQAELISSLSQDEIPIKLRCAVCSRLAVNAFRLPCCDQAICETCQSTLPSSCPVCEHTPVSAEDCKPNKPLRTTIKVFLRTEEKKREALRLKETKITPPITPVEPIPAPIEAPTSAAEVPAETSAEIQRTKAAASPITDQVEGIPMNPEDIAQSHQEQQDIPQPSIEEITPGQEPIQDSDANQAEETAAENGEEENAETNANGQAISQTLGFGAGFGFDPSAVGGFPGMGMGGDINQMQMMMAMQQGMAPNAFGTFPMMGMPGMNMDPMAMQNMQNMMMSGGFGGGMGMNGMNMGMGMAGFDGGAGAGAGAGAGFNNGWNGQQSWNVGQDNFNHPNAASMGHGDYGSNNSGYTPQSAGYSQGNYGRGNQYNDYQNNSFGYRGRGRGRGYGRGGYGYGSHDQFSQQFPQQFGSGQQANGPISDTGLAPTGPKADASTANAGDVDEFGREIRHKSEVKDVAQEEATDKPNEEETSAATNGATENVENIEVNEIPKDISAYTDDSTPKPIQTLDEAEAVAYAHNGTYNAGSSRGGFNSGYHGRGSNFNNMQPPFVKQVDVPINAPTGPKAMREGLPNTGLSGLRSQGFSIASRATPNLRVNDSASVALEPVPSEKDVKDRERSKSPSRERSRSRDRKRSRSRDRHGRSHRRRSNSPIPTEDDKETERRRERRRKRDRGHREEGGDDRRDSTSLDKPTDDDVRDDRVVDERSRSASPSDTKRSSHRSRRDKDKYRERDREDRDKYRERDDDRDHRSSHKHRSSRRHHDDRSRSRDRSDRDREHRHRHSRRGSEDIDDKASKTDKSVPPTPIEAEPPSRRPSVISNGAAGIEIKGASSRHKSTIIEEPSIPTGPRGDRNTTSSRDQKENLKSNRQEHRSSRHRDTDRQRESEKTKEKERSRGAAASAPAPAAQDPHTIEREARNRERLLKEAQRIAGLTAGMAGARKRSRDDVEEISRQKGRKKRGRGGEESEEARVARLEAERESARWG